MIRYRVFSKLDQTPKNIVAIYGEVNHPGEYEFEKNVRISDLILKAGYLTRSAYLLKAQVAKVDPHSCGKNHRCGSDSPAGAA